MCDVSRVTYWHNICHAQAAKGLYLSFGLSKHGMLTVASARPGARAFTIEATFWSLSSGRRFAAAVKVAHISEQRLRAMWSDTGWRMRRQADDAIK